MDRFVNIALKGKGTKKNCNAINDSGAEDVELGKCLEDVNVEAGDSRDKEGKERFFPFNPTTQMIPKNIPSWYWNLMYYSSKNVRI